jgi:hypothetical protein
VVGQGRAREPLRGYFANGARRLHQGQVLFLIGPQVSLERAPLDGQQVPLLERFKQGHAVDQFDLHEARAVTQSSGANLNGRSELEASLV